MVWRRFRLGLMVGMAAALSMAVHASPVSWHVRPDGSDIVCDGQVNAPDPQTGEIHLACAFRTPQKAVDSAGPGDTIFLHAGSYATPGTGTRDRTNIVSIVDRTEFGSEETRLTIRSAGDGDVVFDGGGTIHTGINISGTSYLTIDGIKFRGFTAGPGHDAAGPALVWGNWGATAVDVVPGLSGSSSHLVLRALDVDASAVGAAAFFSADIAIWGEGCDDNLITGAHIVSYEDVAIGVGGGAQRGVIEKSFVKQAGERRQWRGVYGELADTWIARDNAFEAFPASASGTYLTLNDCQGWRISGNAFFHPADGAISISGDTLIGNESHVVINNSVECGGSSGTGVYLAGCVGCQVRNNIIKGCSGAVRLRSDCHGTQLGYNDLFENAADLDADTSGPLPGTGYALVGGDIAGDPLFRKVLPRPDPFFRVRAESPVIDAGDDAFCADSVPVGGCDMGAFQFTGHLNPSQPSLRVEKVTGESAILKGSPFVDPDDGDTHGASQWTVSFGGFVVRDSGPTIEHLRSYRVKGLLGYSRYAARVRYQDGEGNWSDWSREYPFQTLGPYAIPPRVVEVEPADGTIVGPGGCCGMLFNTILDPDSVSPESVTLTAKSRPDVDVPIAPVLDQTWTRVSFSAPLQFDMTYRIAVQGGKNGVLSFDGSLPGKSFSSRFTTLSFLVSSDPADGSSGAPPGVTPQLTFRRGLNPRTVDPSVFTLRDLTRGADVPLASTVLGGTGREVTITPAVPLAAHHRYRITVKSGEAGLRYTETETEPQVPGTPLAGNALGESGGTLAKDIRVTFRTGGD